MERLHRLPLVVLVVLLGVAAAVTVLANAAVASQERRLLTERANEVNLVVTNSVSTVSTNLGILARSYDLGGVAGFSPAASAQISSSQSPVGLALVRPDRGGFVVATSDGKGLRAGQELTGAPVLAIRAAEAGSKVTATGIYTVGGTRSVGFALRAADGTVVYQQTLFGPVRAPSGEGTRPFSELRVVVYTSARPDPREVLVATTTALPLHGSVRYVPLMVGATQWLTAVSAVHPLVGSVAHDSPWIALAVGVVGSVLVFLLLEGMVRRRYAAIEALESEHRFAETLQRRLLPTVPTLTGLDVASSYVPGANHQQVGGDWFDVFELPSGQVAVVIGDVMGHDVEAAALMAQLRASLRAYAAEGGDPAWTIERLATFVDLYTLPTVVTAIFGVLDPPQADGSRRFTWANAGHLPPLLRHPDGRAEQLTEGASPLLGAPAALPRPIGRRELPPGSTLLLYTDGLVETEAEHLGVAIDRLRDTFATADQATADEICATVLSTQLPSARRDDVALLVVTVRTPSSPETTQDRAATRSASEV